MAAAAAAAMAESVVAREEMEEGEIVGADEVESREENEEDDVIADDAVENVERQPATHPLENQWTFWFDNPSNKSKQSSWGSSLRNLYTFSTVEEFWGVYNNIHHPSKLIIGADFYCFKDKIEPKWEDPMCEKGGKWTIVCSRGKADTYWLYTLLAMIGEQFDNGDDICGAVVNVRAKQERISIWTKNGHNEASQMSIGKQWKQILVYNETIGFILHDDAKKQDRNAKNRYQA